MFVIIFDLIWFFFQDKFWFSFTHKCYGTWNIKWLYTSSKNPSHSQAKYGHLVRVLGVEGNGLIKLWWQAFDFTLITSYEYQVFSILGSSYHRLFGLGLFFLWRVQLFVVIYYLCICHFIWVKLGLEIKMVVGGGG